MKQYKIIIDYGKPYTEYAKTETELKAKLNILKDLANSDEYPYFDIVILKGEKDITEETFKEVFKDEL